MRTLAIDIETYSSNNIKCGVRKYADASDFEVLLFAYAFDDEPVEIVDFTAGEELPEKVLRAMRDPHTVKTAFNAAFEITCLRRATENRQTASLAEVVVRDEEWECTSVLSLYNALPPGLGPTAEALGFEKDKQKDTRGAALIRYFCVPCKPTKANGGRTRNLPEHDREKWETFKEYCRQDVVVERAIREKLIGNKPDMVEHELWLVDLGINRRGVAIDSRLVGNAIAISREYADKLTKELKELTGLENPNSIAQLKGWLEDSSGAYINISSLDKAAVETLLANTADESTKKVLRLRQLTGKTSIKKYEAMQNSVCGDGRIHDLFQFYGASRTGRWAGRNVQLQNLPRNYLEDLDAARELVKAGDLDILDMMYDSVPDVLSQLIRTALIPKPGYKFIVADFSAIEARVIAWLAGETWRQKVFAEGGDIYCASASAMFGVPVVKNGVNGHLRQKGKVAELALGYQGGPGALIQMGALDMGLSEDELPGIVEKWRAASPHIVDFWRAAEHSARLAIESRGKARIKGTEGVRPDISFEFDDGNLYIVLPSGRKLCYRNARIGTNRFDRPAIIYKGLNQTTKDFEDLKTYGGKLVENITQAVARDCLAVAIDRLSHECGYDVVGHIHDEVIIEAPDKPEYSLDRAIRIMTQNCCWNEGLKMDAAGFEGKYYMKD